MRTHWHQLRHRLPVIAVTLALLGNASLSLAAPPPKASAKSVHPTQVTPKSRNIPWRQATVTIEQHIRTIEGVMARMDEVYDDHCEQYLREEFLKHGVHGQRALEYAYDWKNTIVYNVWDRVAHDYFQAHIERLHASDDVIFKRGYATPEEMQYLATGTARLAEIADQIDGLMRDGFSAAAERALEIDRAMAARAEASKAGSQLIAANCNGQCMAFYGARQRQFEQEAKNHDFYADISSQMWGKLNQKAETLAKTEVFSVLGTPNPVNPDAVAAQILPPKAESQQAQQTPPASDPHQAAGEDRGLPFNLDQIRNSPRPPEPRQLTDEERMRQMEELHRQNMEKVRQQEEDQRRMQAQQADRLRKMAEDANRKYYENRYELERQYGPKPSDWPADKPWPWQLYPEAYEDAPPPVTEEMQVGRDEYQRRLVERASKAYEADKTGLEKQYGPKPLDWPADKPWPPALYPQAYDDAPPPVTEEMQVGWQEALRRRSERELQQQTTGESPPPPPGTSKADWERQLEDFKKTQQEAAEDIPPPPPGISKEAWDKQLQDFKNHQARKPARPVKEEASGPPPDYDAAQAKKDYEEKLYQKGYEAAMRQVYGPDKSKWPREASGPPPEN